jgi:hypothetical protein
MEHLYILSNKSMGGLLKIGCTKKSVTDRSKALFTTGVPDKFDTEAIFPTSDSKRFEDEAFKALAPYRNKKQREFFKLNVRQAIDLLLPIYDERFRPDESDSIPPEVIESETLTENEEAAIFLIGRKHPGWTAQYEIRDRIAQSDLEADYIIKDLASRNFVKHKRGMMDTEVVQLDHAGLTYLKSKDMLDPEKLRNWELNRQSKRPTRSNDLTDISELF